VTGINFENSSYGEVIAARDRAATQVEYRRLDFFGLLFRGYEAEEAMEIMLVSRASYYRWVKLFNEQGLSGLTPKRSPGRPRKISEELGVEIVELIRDPSIAGEYHWTALKLHGYLQQGYEIKFSYRTLVRCLHEREVRRIVPRRKPFKQDTELRERFLIELNALYQNKKNNLYFLDESGFEGDPKPRKEWVPPGYKASTHYLGDHIRTNVIGAVAPRTGELLAFAVPYVDTGVFQTFINHVRQQTAHLKNVYLVLDNASWHTTTSIEWGEIKPIFLPPYSPDLNPIEQLWNHLKASYLGNKAAKTFDELDERVCNALLAMIKQPDKIRSLCSPKLAL
jgi:transposase